MREAEEDGRRADGQEVSVSLRLRRGQGAEVLISLGAGCVSVPLAGAGRRGGSVAGMNVRSYNCQMLGKDCNQRKSNP